MAKLGNAMLIRGIYRSVATILAGCQFSRDNASVVEVCFIRAERAVPDSRRLGIRAGRIQCQNGPTNFSN